MPISGKAERTGISSAARLPCPDGSSFTVMSIAAFSGWVVSGARASRMVSFVWPCASVSGNSRSLASGA